MSSRCISTLQEGDSIGVKIVDNAWLKPRDNEGRNVPLTKLTILKMDWKNQSNQLLLGSKEEFFCNQVSPEIMSQFKEFKYFDYLFLGGSNYQFIYRIWKKPK